MGSIFILANYGCMVVGCRDVRASLVWLRPSLVVLLITSRDVRRQRPLLSPRTIKQFLKVNMVHGGNVYKHVRKISGQWRLWLVAGPVTGPALFRKTVTSCRSVQLSDG